MNNFIGTGRLVRDVDVRVGGETTIARFTIASTRPVKNKEGKYDADFISCVAFGKTAEIAGDHCKKGDSVAVEGTLRTGSYTNKKGDKVYTTDVYVNRLEFLGGNKPKEDNPMGAMGKFADEDVPF